MGLEALPAWVVPTVAGLLGLVTGSFATVAIHRWPRGGTVNAPRRSQCPGCSADIPWYRNLPLMGWIAAKGRCHSCATRISLRYPVTELLVASAFVALSLRFGAVSMLPVLLVMAWVLIVAALIDLDFSIIPNRLTLTAPGVLLVLVAFAAWTERDLGLIGRAVLYGVLVPTVMFVLSEGFRLMRGQAGIGMGDIKLALSLGITLGALGGWYVVVFAYASVLSAVVVAIGLLLAGRARLASKIPFGPYLAIGTFVAMVAAEPLAGWFNPWSR